MDDYAAIADLYDHVTPYKTRGDIGFFVSAAKVAGSPILEIGCGTGRVLIPIAREGILVTGLDASASMLAICRERLEAEKPAVRARATLVEGDMRSFDLRTTFTLATIPFRPFQHLVTVDDQLACLAAIHRHLVPGGTLILDLFNPSLDALVNRPIGDEVPDTPEFVTPDGRRVTRTARTLSHDRAAQVTEVELIYHITHADGRTARAVHAFSMRYLFRYEAEHLLARAGFKVEQLYAGYDRSPFGSHYPGELVFVATKA